MQLELDINNDDRDACPRCGARLVRRRVGRTKIWCSPQCRRLAYDARRAAEAGELPVKVIQRIDRVELTINQCVARVIESPVGCARVLQAVGRLIDADELSDAGKWSKTTTAVYEFLAAVRRSSQRRASRGPVHSRPLSTDRRPLPPGVFPTTHAGGR
jgi:hypothetical protein